MKRKIIFSVITLAFLWVGIQSIELSKDKKRLESKTAHYYFDQVDSLLLKANELIGKVVTVKGIIEHVCSNSNPGRNVKIFTPGSNEELKIIISEKMQPLTIDDEGKVVIARGTLTPVKMDLKAVKKWEFRARNNHKGEENTDHFKVEIEKIKTIQEKLRTGKILHYIQYHIVEASINLEE